MTLTKNKKETKLTIPILNWNDYICDFIMSEVIKNDTGKTLLMDNAQSHKNKKLKEEMKKTGK